MKTVEIHPVHTTYHTSKYLLTNLALTFTKILFFLIWYLFNDLGKN